MTITRNNYEVYFLDYLEADLNPALEEEFHNFLEANPDLKAELDDMQTGVSIPIDNVVFDGKEKLKQNENTELSSIANDFETSAIAYIENDLSSTEKIEFEAYVKDKPKAQKSLHLFRQTKLVADKSIVYKEKSALKRALFISLSQHAFYKYASIAASLLLILSLYFLTENGRLTNPEKFSQKSIYPNTFNINDEKLSDLTPQEEETLVPENNSIVAFETLKSVEGVEAKKKKSTIEKKIDGVKMAIPQIDPKQAKGEDEKEKQNQLLKEGEKVKVLEAQQEKPNIKKQTSPAKKFVKPVQIHSQGLLASNSAKKDEDNQYLSLRQLATRFFKKKVLKQEEKEINSNKVDFWEIADAGVKGLNKVTRRDTKLIREYNSEGELIAYAVESPLLSFEKSFHKK